MAMAMGIVTKRPKERQSNGGSQRLPQPQLLDSPLPTPRRSCASTDAPSLRCRPDAYTPRTQVPFSWESSPGVPKSMDVHKAQDIPPPNLPPGRWSPCPSRNWCYGNASEASSDDCETPSSFSDGLHKLSSSERMASFDRVTSRLFEDIFIGRAASFVKDRSRHAHATAIAPASSSGKHPKHWRRRITRHDDDGEKHSIDPVQQSQVVPPRIDIDQARVEQISPRACGLMVFFPWSPKPAVCGLRSPSSRYTAGANDPPPPSHSRRTATLRDALQVKEASSGEELPRGEKRSREEWQGRGWGVSSLFGTSKKYCTDARKALSKLSIGLGADHSGSPRVGREVRSSSKQDAMAAKLTRLKTNIN